MSGTISATITTTYSMTVGPTTGLSTAASFVTATSCHSVIGPSGIAWTLNPATIADRDATSAVGVQLHAGVAGATADQTAIYVTGGRVGTYDDPVTVDAAAVPVNAAADWSATVTTSQPPVRGIERPATDRPIGVPVGFAAGTRIATPTGEVPVERLAVGDQVLTASGQACAIVRIRVAALQATRGCRGEATPVIVRQAALAQNLPHRDLRMTKTQSLYIDGALIPVELLINHRSVLWDDMARHVAIHQVELATHDVLLANGAPVDSYRDADPDARSPLPAFAQVLTDGPAVDAAWRRMLDAAGPRPGLAMSDDPDLHLLVDGARLDPTSHVGDTYIFQLPERARDVRIASRAGVPAELGLARDSRSLGVALRGIELRQGRQVRTLEMRDPGFTDGFYPFEPHDGLRWTNGDAAVAAALLSTLPGAKELRVLVARSIWYPI